MTIDVKNTKFLEVVNSMYERSNNFLPSLKEYLNDIYETQTISSENTKELIEYLESVSEKKFYFCEGFMYFTQIVGLPPHIAIQKLATQMEDEYFLHQELLSYFYKQ